MPSWRWIVAWERLSTVLQDAGEELVVLAGLAHSLTVEADGEVAAVRAEIETLRGWVARDPLGAEARLEVRLTPLLGQLRGHLESLARERQEVQDGRTRAARLLGNLRATHASALQAFGRHGREIRAAAARTPLPNGGAIDGLAGWLTTLRSVIDAGRWSTARVGLSRWLPAAERQLDLECGALAASAGPLATREELLGRVSARRAQLRALQLRGQLADPELDSRARKLEDALERLPVALDEVVPLADAFEADLAPLLRQAGPAGPAQQSALRPESAGASPPSDRAPGSEPTAPRK